MSDEKTPGAASRRRILRLLGAGTAGTAAVGSGLGAARPMDDRGRTANPDVDDPDAGPPADLADGDGCFQLDLVGGDPIESFDYSEGRTYSGEDRLVEDFFACAGEEKAPGRSGGGTFTVDGGECPLSWDEFRFDGENAFLDVSVGAFPDDVTECTATFAGYRLPDGVEDEPGDLEAQEFCDADTRTFQRGRQVTTLEISLVSRERWRFETGGDVRAGPTVTNDTVYVSSDFDNVYALDANSGDERWRFDIGGRSASPTVLDGTVYVGVRDDDVYALDADSGDKQWRFETRGQWDGTPPKAVNGLVYVSSFVGSPGSTEGTFYALDATDGGVVWRVDAEDSFGSPTVVDGTVYVASGDTILALNADDGTEAWRFSFGGGGGFNTPTVVDGTVFASAENRPSLPYLYALDADTGEEVWSVGGRELTTPPTVVDGTIYAGTEFGRVLAFSDDTGEELWAFRSSSGFIPASGLQVDGDAVYVTGMGGLERVDAETGVERWRTNPEGRGLTGPVRAVGDTIFAGGRRLFAIDAATGEIRWTVLEDVTSSMTVVDGIVYIGAGEAVLAIQVDLENDGEDSRTLPGTPGHPDA